MASPFPLVFGSYVDGCLLPWCLALQMSIAALLKGLLSLTSLRALVDMAYLSCLFLPFCLPPCCRYHVKEMYRHFWTRT